MMQHMWSDFNILEIYKMSIATLARERRRCSGQFMNVMRTRSSQLRLRGLMVAPRMGLAVFVPQKAQRQLEANKKLESSTTDSIVWCGSEMWHRLPQAIKTR